MDKTALGWPLWILVSSLPWLLSTHSDPWTTFYNDFMAAATLLPLFVWLLFFLSTGWVVTYLEMFILSVSVVPFFQAVSGVLLFPGESFLFVASIFVFSVAVSVGRQGQIARPYRVVDSLFSSFVVASILSVGLALYQWLALDGLGVLVPSASLGGMRVVAHVGQANNLATLLVWGCAGVWWAYYRRQLGGVCSVLACAFFLLGVVLTGSRTGCIQVAFLSVMAFVLWWPHIGRRQLIAMVVLVGWFFSLLVIIPFLGDLLFGAQQREMLSVGVRPRFWSMALEGIAERPLVGYGWNQITTVHVGLSEKYSGLNEVMGHAHNIFLDLLLWNGVLVGGVLVVAIVWWGVRQVIRVQGEGHGIVLAAIGVFFVHAMLELPHLYLIFLIPVGLLVGVANSFLSVRGGVTLPRYFMIVVGAIMAVFLVVIFRDYRLVEESLVVRKLVAARISGAVVPPSPDVILLKSLQGALERLDTQPSRNMSAETLEGKRLAILRYPTTGGLFRYAQASALNNKPAEAAWALSLICNLRSKEDCESAVNDWKVVASSGNPEMGAVVLPRVE